MALSLFKIITLALKVIGRKISQVNSMIELEILTGIARTD